MFASDGAGPAAADRDGVRLAGRAGAGGGRRCGCDGDHQSTSPILNIWRM